MASAESPVLLHALSAICGWVYTIAWSLSFYPQILLNIRRSSTTGTTPAFPLLNVLGFSSYSLSSIAFYTSSTIQLQYQERHNGEKNTVRGNDVAFAVHALVLSAITFSQFWSSLWGFERRKWVIGRGVWGIVTGSCVAVLWMTGMAWAGATGWEWIDVIYAVGYVKLIVSVVKYVPQAWANYKRKSTVGWAIEPVLLDLLGGVLSIAQLVIDSSMQDDWSGLTGNPVKLGLGNISIIFDVVFMSQHFLFYRNASKVVEDVPEAERQRLLTRYQEEASSVG